MVEADRESRAAALVALPDPERPSQLRFARSRRSVQVGKFVGNGVGPNKIMFLYQQQVRQAIRQSKESRHRVRYAQMGSGELARNTNAPDASPERAPRAYGGKRREGAW